MIVYGSWRKCEELKIEYEVIWTRGMKRNESQNVAYKRGWRRDCLL